MPRTTATVSFQAIELKGSLLPASLLEQVARLQAPMQKEADYGLAKGERLRERIDAAWVRLKEIWEEYKDLRERAAQSTAGLHFAQRLLREVLGWPDLQACNGWQHGDSFYTISHRAFAEPQAHAATSQGTSQASVPLILRGIPADQLDRGSAAFGQEGRRRSPHSCLQECLNADDSTNWGLLLSGDRLRLLHASPSLVKPAYLQADLELLVEGELFDEFAVLWLLLHTSSLRHPQTGSCVSQALPIERSSQYLRPPGWLPCLSKPWLFPPAPRPGWHGLHKDSACASAVMNPPDPASGRSATFSTSW
jgi:hypothetical protein